MTRSNQSTQSTQSTHCLPGSPRVVSLARHGARELVLRAPVAACSLILALSLPSAAHASPATVAQIETAEKSFWQGFNGCDLAVLESRLAADVEFYHDMGGLTRGRAAVVDAVRRNICGDAHHKVRREPAPDARTSLLKQGDTVYGALVTGSHSFHARHGAAPEAPEGRALYAHLWLARGATWELARVISYEHGPFAAVPATPGATSALTAAQIDRYVGNFTGPGLPPLALSRTGDNLTVAFEGRQLVLHPLAKANTFLVKENNAEVEFSPASGAAVSVLIRMDGKVVGEAGRN